jgi:hypothetical protein
MMAEMQAETCSDVAGLIKDTLQHGCERRIVVFLFFYVYISLHFLVVTNMFSFLLFPINSYRSYIVTSDTDLLLFYRKFLSAYQERHLIEL